MDVWNYVVTLAGALLVAAVLCEVFLVVLHIESDGFLAPVLQHSIWTLAVRASQIASPARRLIMSLAGPVMILVMYGSWLLLFILGFALIVAPHLNVAFRADTQINRPLTFADALYFSGGTATVLGYGDITPLSVPWKTLTWVESALGFGLLTGVVTYLLNVISGFSDRHALASRLHTATGETGDGVWLVIRYARQEPVAALHARLRDLQQALSDLREKMRQFPILDLYYRAHDPLYAPELMFRTLVDAALAFQLLAHNDRSRELLPAAEDFDRTTTHLLSLVARKYLDPETARRFQRPEPTDQDREHVVRQRERLEKHLDVEWSADLPPAALHLAHRRRVFLAALDERTAWRMDDPPPPRRDAT